MNFLVFSQLFVPVLVLMLSVGPVFISVANISITYGYKKGFFVATATLLGNLIYITIGAFAAKSFIAIIPKTIMIILPLIGSGFLLNLAYGFWKKDLSKLKEIDIQKFDFALLVKMFCLILSSPVAIVGYSVIFTSIATEIETALPSALLGGYCGAITGKIIVVMFFGTIGKKCSKRILTIINKISACLLCFYAILLISKVAREIINLL